MHNTMFEISYVYEDIKCIVHVKLGAELSYEELVNIREEVRQRCNSCPHYIAIYDYAEKPSFKNFGLTAYRQINALLLDIVINLGMNPVQRSITKLVYSIKPSSHSMYFVDSLDDAITLSKELLPDLFKNGNSTSC